jgi:hypothetical protein
MLTSVIPAYAYIPSRGAERFDLMIRNKSAIQLRLPYLLSFIILFGVDLVLNLHIVLLI